MVCRVAARLYDAGTACTACAYGWRVHALAECKFINKFANNEINRADNLIFSGFYAFRMSAEVCPWCGMVCADCGMRLAVSAFYVYLCMIRRVARGDKAGTLRGCRRSRNMSECVLRRHNAEENSHLFRFRSATDTFFSCGKAFSGAPESLFGDAEKPLPHDERARSAEPQKRPCCL